MRYLEQQPGPVTCLGITATSPAMGEVNENLQALLNNVVSLVTLDTGNEADATSIMLVLRVVKTLFRWQPVVQHTTLACEAQTSDCPAGSSQVSKPVSRDLSERFLMRTRSAARLATG